MGEWVRVENDTSGSFCLDWRQEWVVWVWGPPHPFPEGGFSPLSLLFYFFSPALATLSAGSSGCLVHSSHDPS